MPHYEFLWTAEIEAHLAEHDVSRAEVEYVVQHPSRKGFSRATELPVAWGYTEDRRYLMVVYEEIDAMSVLPVTAYEVPEP